jgi:hypothetical protein
MRPPRYRQQIESVVASTWPDECVRFAGKQQPNGYGRVSVDGRYVRAHVLACRLAHGERPEGKTDAAHSCGNNMCINPRHLRWATRKENEADKVAHGRTIRGEASGTARLTRDQVNNIRAEYAAGGITQQQLADKNGVHIMTINDIIKRRTWAF